VLEKLAQQRERPEEELKQETRRYDKKRKRDRAQVDSDDDDDHARLAFAAERVTNAATVGRYKTEVRAQLRSAPKGTMARLVLKIAKAHQHHEH
jgi:hypothetical protein